VTAARGGISYFDVRRLTPEAQALGRRSFIVCEARNLKGLSRGLCFLDNLDVSKLPACSYIPVTTDGNRATPISDRRGGIIRLKMIASLAPRIPPRLTVTIFR
jgi:hypothetical protein